MEKPRLNKAVAELLGISDTGTKLTKRAGHVTMAGAGGVISSSEPETFQKSILKQLNRQGDTERLAFEVDPKVKNEYGSIYKTKTRLLPDKILKRIAIQDDLVAAIIQARSNHVGAFGRIRPDRFSTGFVIDLRQEAIEAIEKITDAEQKRNRKDELQRRIASVTKKMLTCGDINLDLAGNQDKLTLPQYLQMSARNAVVVGRIATEVLRKSNGEFSGFRVIDAGTIYKSVPRKGAANAVRTQARALLATLKNREESKIDVNRFEEDQYAWIQVGEDGNQPIQAFTDKECLVHNFFPVPDIELDGYPVTPLDTVITAVTTHINITTHNKLYFESGRAARGMLVIKSDEVDDSTISKIRQQFNHQINSVDNSWRMPVFGVGTTDEISWQPIDSGTRDMEFQYLTDMNARIILTAFMMSPEELPGWSYLSRGTNNQSLCLSYSSKITTEDGLKTIGQILEGVEEKEVRVWTGTSWQSARVFRTGPKQTTTTLLKNGSRLETSPDHRFRAIGPEGEPVWKRQKDLVIGDSVLVNKLPIDGVGDIPTYGDKPLSEDMMEVLGWMTGDGNFSIRYQKNTGNIKQGVLSWFYHHEKELDVWERHSAILKNFGLDHKHQDRKILEEEGEAIKSRYGFKSVAPNRLRNTLYDTDFCRWLLSLGFTDSSNGKSVPAFVHVLPVGHRQAFLRGLFSADGTKTSSADGVRIVIHDDVIRSQVRDLLLGLGIRTQLHEGVLKRHIQGDVRSMVAGKSTLAIKDKLAFYERVGFLQVHKQPDLAALAVSHKKWEKVPGSVAARLLAGLGSVKNVARTWKDGCALSFLTRELLAAGREVPEWLNSYYLEEVEEVSASDEVVDMADVEVFDTTHAFVCNGAIVHNSEGNNEYKMQAARDVGIRPLLAQFEDFLNNQILPLFDKELAQLATIKLVGLESETAEKESVRLQQDQALHMTYDEILAKVEKRAIGKLMGGEFPLNPAYAAILDKYKLVGEIKEHFLGEKGAGQDPQWQYARDPFWFQWQQLLMQKQQMEQQAQMQQQQAAQQAQGGGDGGPPQDDGGGGGAPQGESQPTGEAAKPDRETNQTENQKSAAQEESSASGAPDLTRSIDQAVDLLTKAEKQLPNHKRTLINQHKMLIQDFMDGWSSDLEAATADILEVATKLVPKKK